MSSSVKAMLPVKEGYKVLPNIDKERYTELPGLEGPFQTMSGKPIYYDPKEGAYYDRDTDMYLTYDEFKALDEDKGVEDDEYDPRRVKANVMKHLVDMYNDAKKDDGYSSEKMDFALGNLLHDMDMAGYMNSDYFDIEGFFHKGIDKKQDYKVNMGMLKKAYAQAKNLPDDTTVDPEIFTRGGSAMKHVATEAMTDKEVNDFHNALDKVVHKHIGHSSDEDEEKERLTKKIDEMPIPKSTMYGLVIDGKYVAKGSKRDMVAMKKEKGGEVYNAPGKKVGDSVGKVKESGIMYRAGVKKYGKEGMTKIQSAAGSGASAEEIGRIKDKYNKKKTEGHSPHAKGSAKYKKHMAAKHAAMAEKLTISNMRKALDLEEDTDSNTVIAGYVRTMLNEKHNTWNKVTKEIDFVINLLEDTKADRLQVLKLLYKKNIQENQDNKIELKESIDKLRKIVADKSAMPIKFSDGTMKVDMTTASIFLQAYDKMKDRNQMKIQDMMKTKAGFLRVLDFIYGAMK